MSHVGTVLWKLVPLTHILAHRAQLPAGASYTAFSGGHDNSPLVETLFSSNTGVHPLAVCDDSKPRSTQYRATFRGFFLKKWPCFTVSNSHVLLHLNAYMLF